ncbi:hypothetical protein [Paenibacillus sp. y28]|uniref:hypothetical protein n=1 Tax=Paenibacillus sp. y28 TaxID=3129110 RepID=UPI00301622EC
MSQWFGRRQAGGQRKEQITAAQYEQLFLYFSSRWERWLIRAAVVLVSLLVFFQLLLQWEPLRHALVKVERLEGEPYEWNGTARDK